MLNHHRVQWSWSSIFKYTRDLNLPNEFMGLNAGLVAVGIVRSGHRHPSLVLFKVTEKGDPQKSFKWEIYICCAYVGETFFIVAWMLPESWTLGIRHLPGAYLGDDYRTCGGFVDRYHH